MKGLEDMETRSRESLQEVKEILVQQIAESERVVDDSRKHIKMCQLVLTTNKQYLEDAYKELARCEALLGKSK